MSCLAIGIILSVSAKREELKQKETKDLDEDLEDNPLEVLAETI
jgi:cell division protein FtsW